MLVLSFIVIVLCCLNIQLLLMINNYRKLVESKNELINSYRKSLDHMDIVVDESFKLNDYLLSHILTINPDDQVAAETRTKIRRSRETTTEVWAEKAKERLSK